jgi:hypothetical protein
MKQRPILFNTEMVQAILAGRKSQTRRVVKPQPDEDGLARHLVNLAWEDTSGNQYKCPYGKPGDVLWAREAHLVCHDDRFLEGMDSRVVFKASVHNDWYLSLREENPHYKWMPSIHMNKAFARIWLRITDVRVERLQSISMKDAIREGIESIDHGARWKNYVQDEISSYVFPRHSFESLWQSINGLDSWNDNPWVWAIEFERIEKP